jgi:hypothetical protein
LVRPVTRALVPDPEESNVVWAVAPMYGVIV